MKHAPRICPLSRKHDRAGFTCGVRPLDQYFRHQAGQDQRKRVAATFVLADGASVYGCYTLSAAGIALDDLPVSITHKLPKYPVVPATLLGRLAVSQLHRNRGFGSLLLMDALLRSLEHSAQIASFAVIVDAKDERAHSFHQAYGFLDLIRSRARLFLPMAAIAAPPPR